jgi:hypothetical protein
MMHGDNESLLASKQSETATRAAIRRKQFLEFFWLQMIYRVGAQLEQLKRVNNFLLFSESWTSKKCWGYIKRERREYWTNLHGTESFLAAMMELGGRPQVTECSRAYALSGKLERRKSLQAQGLGEGTSSHLDEITVCRRDREVARHLNRLVPPGEVAVLCMGAAHDVPRYLEEGWTIRVITHAAIYNSIAALAIHGQVTFPQTWTLIFRQQLEEASPKEYQRVVELPTHLTPP